MLNHLWERHKNIWSWYMRPPFGFLLFYGAWLNSWLVLFIGFFGLATSWFWFPKPAVVHPTVEKFIDIERQFITPPWTKTKIVGILAVISFLIISLLLFWYRSLALGLMVMFIGGLAKAIWSVSVADKAGYIPAIFGIFWAALSISIYLYTLK